MNIPWIPVVILLSSLAALGERQAAAGDLDEFKIKRQEVFEFTQKPRVRQEGDRVEVTFESKGWCDVTVAVENASGGIVRHLASGVLGPQAPDPFQKNSLNQMLVWDGKNDQGKYLDDKEALRMRVSLGLKPYFERAFYSSPHKRTGAFTPLLQAAEEGMYVYDTGGSLDHLRLFNHPGDYVRTLYPIPADRIDRVDGLSRHLFPQEGKSLPVKTNFLQNTFLTSGDNAIPLTYRPATKTYESIADKFPQHYGMYGVAAKALAARQGRIALVYQSLNRLGADGSSGGLPMPGPKTSVTVTAKVRQSGGRNRVEVAPQSAAFSPDGKTLYLTGFLWKELTSGGEIGFPVWTSLPAVTALDYAGDAPPALFAGSFKTEQEGKEPGRFRIPACVACDGQGRVYVADFGNDRVEIFAKDGKHLKSLPVAKPAKVFVHQLNGKIYVFSHPLPETRVRDQEVAGALTVFGAFEDPRLLQRIEVPWLSGKLGMYGTVPVGDLGWLAGMVSGEPVQIELDSWTPEPVFWIARERTRNLNGSEGQAWEQSSLRLYELKDGKLVLRRDFAQDAARVVARLDPPGHLAQRLTVNPRSGKLYLAEGEQVPINSVREVLEFDSTTGRGTRVPLPFSADDLAFDLDGFIYLRSHDAVARYEPATWREVPWDYGEEMRNVGLSANNSGHKLANLISGLPLPCNSRWHQGGMFVTPQGHLAVACYYGAPEDGLPRDAKALFVRAGFRPRLYPGRLTAHHHGGTYLHIWDKHGRLQRMDAVPGLAEVNGLGLDRDGALYVMAAPTRVFDGQRYFNDLAGTLIKFPPGKGRLLSAQDRADRVPVPLGEADKPKRPVDLTSGYGGGQWVEGAEWMYAGVGWGGKNRGSGCGCHHARFCLDLFARSFAPELDRYSVAVLDSRGNLILRIGQYGNADSAGPQSLVPLGGDEVGLFHGAYLATQSDKRLFIADAGNGRLLSVTLGYHKEERIVLGQVPDAAFATTPGPEPK